MSQWSLDGTVAFVGRKLMVWLTGRYFWLQDVGHGSGRGMPFKTRAMGSLLLYPWRLEGAVVRAVPAKGCGPVVKIIPWVKHIGTKEKLGTYSFFFFPFFFFVSMKSNRLSRIWASENEDLSHISKHSGKLSSAIQISFEPPNSIILSNWKFFFLGKKNLMQAGLKALSPLEHPMGLSKLPCDEFIVLPLPRPYGLHSSKSKQSLTRW